MLNGTFGGGSVTTSGTGTVYLVGNVSGVMQINAGGITSVFVQGTPSESDTGWSGLDLGIQRL